MFWIVLIFLVYLEVCICLLLGGIVVLGMEMFEIDKEGDILYIFLRFIDFLYKRDNFYLDFKIVIIILYFFLVLS